MRRHLLVLVCVWAAVAGLAAASSSSLAWRRFKSEHEKVYEPEEDAMRFANFLETKQIVERHNANPNATFKMGLNHMADWTREEQQQLIGVKLIETQRIASGDSLSPKLAKLLEGPVPKEVDWRKVPNRVTAVKYQGPCDSNWAFATTGLLEGQQAVLNISEIIPLSEQELLDCSYSNDGCNGGVPSLALQDIASPLNGIVSEANYPYEGKGGKGECRMDTSKVVMTVKGGSHLKKSEEELLKAIANYGPVAAVIHATDNFIHYSSGVLDDDDCSGSRYADLAVLVVGYGTDPKGGDFWLIKNSWGTNWGDEGYIKMKRGVNMCAIADQAYVATF